MAQISTLGNGEMILELPHRARALPEGRDFPVRRFGFYLHALIADIHFIPTVADFEGHPIKLYSILDPAVQGWISGEQEFEFYKALLAMERRANEYLAQLTQKYVYHFVFKIGLQQYYIRESIQRECTTSTDIFQTHYRRENQLLETRPRGIEERIRAQSICYEAFKHQLRLNDWEKESWQISQIVLLEMQWCSVHVFLLPFVLFFLFFTKTD